MSLFVFFKQKTAYEMRMSDWSSDVCSADRRQAEGQKRALGGGDGDVLRDHLPHHHVEEDDDRQGDGEADRVQHRVGQLHHTGDGVLDEAGDGRLGHERSEEHTSELQSLMRLSYAVSCFNQQHSTKPYNPYPVTPTHTHQRHT